MELRWADEIMPRISSRLGEYETGSCVGFDDIGLLPDGNEVDSSDVALSALSEEAAAAARWAERISRWLVDNCDVRTSRAESWSVCIWLVLVDGRGDWQLSATGPMWMISVCCEYCELLDTLSFSVV